MSLTFLHDFLERQNLSGLSKEEVQELSNIVFNAILVETDNTRENECRMLLDSSKSLPSPKVVDILLNESFSFVFQHGHQYIVWKRKFLCNV